jgi:hypothetical protein
LWQDKKLLKILRNKNFWLSVAHVVVAGASITGAVLVPGAAPLIISGQALLNGLIPSPLSSKATAPPVPINITTGSGIEMKDSINAGGK